MERFFDLRKYGWCQIQALENAQFTCGYCGYKVSSDRGYKIGHNKDGSGAQAGGVFICPNCFGPTFIDIQGDKFPGHSFGNKISHLPADINDLYEEARICTSQNCFTATVMICRKLLMNVAVDLEAEENLRFIEYVIYLSDKGYVPPQGKHWIDHIRKKGNEANHEIKIMNNDDARDLIVFTEMLLKFNYEFPKMVPTEDPAETQ